MSIVLIIQQSFVRILSIGNDFLACHFKLRSLKFTFLNTKKAQKTFLSNTENDMVLCSLYQRHWNDVTHVKNVWRMCFICDQLTLRRPSFSFRATARRWRCRQYARTTVAGRTIWWWSSARRATCTDMCWPTDTSTFSVGSRSFVFALLSVSLCSAKRLENRSS